MKRLMMVILLGLGSSVVLHSCRETDPGSIVAELQVVTSTCEAARSYANTSNDASGVIQTCINNTPAGGVLDLPAGRYTLAHQLQVTARPITLTTSGLYGSTTPCAFDNGDSRCAELQAAFTFSDGLGLLFITAAGTTIDHIVINGMKWSRAGSATYNACVSSSTDHSGITNVWMGCDSCSFNYSVSRGSLCGSGFILSGQLTGQVPRYNTIYRSNFNGNGVHNIVPSWADGLTVHDCESCYFWGNESNDNTDIDIVFGGCRDCTIQNNSVWHDPPFESSSFVGLHIQAWPWTSGDYTGADISYNTINGGVNKNVGWGIMVGGDPWYTVRPDGSRLLPFGGAIHNNLVHNAQRGFTIDDAHDINIYSNTVLYNAGYALVLPQWGCAKPGRAFTRGDDSYNIPNLLGGYVQDNWWGGFANESINCDNELPVGTTLYAGNSTWSRDRRFQLLMQGDGNLVLYYGSSALWNSGTQYYPNAYVIMQGDGNLVIYRQGGIPVWSTNTQGHNGASLIVQDDGNVVIYGGSPPCTGPNGSCWNSGTCCY